MRMALILALLTLFCLPVAAASDAANPAEPIAIDASAYHDPTLPDCGFQRAIDEAADAPAGGVVTLPEGTFALRRGLVLKSNVQLHGAGMDKTILRPARELKRLDATRQSPDKDGLVHLAEIPEDMGVGSAVVSCRSYPIAWYGSPRPAWVTEVDRAAKTVTLEGPYGLNTMKPGVGYLTFGTTIGLEKDIAKGDTQIVVKSSFLLKPGDEITLGTPGNESMLSHAFVKSVDGKTVTLESPAQKSFTAWPDKKSIGNKKVSALIWLIFPMVHNANIQDAALRDLTIRGRALGNVRPTNTRYTLSGLHIYNGTRCVYERVAVRDWPADGFSLQTGADCKVIDCVATGCSGNGFHPGTSLKTTLFERCLAKANGTGLYFCWHNRGHIMRECTFIENRGGGITGLGNPGDRGNTIERCEISRNGGPGIAINGGGEANNVIRDNVIEDNSQQAPGKHPGIALHARIEDARAYTLTGNTVRDTQEEPTQHVGIEEKHGMRLGKHCIADGNVIAGNTLSGHRKADIIVVGSNTELGDNGDATTVVNRSNPRKAARQTEADKTGNQTAE